MNGYVKSKTFKYEDLRTLTEILEKNDFFINFDLKSGYHHVDINPAHQKYFGFEWDFEVEGKNLTRFFVFTVLPFGLTSASYVFSKRTIFS